jgi:hypothetical protein
MHLKQQIISQEAPNKLLEHKLVESENQLRSSNAVKHARCELLMLTLIATRKRFTSINDVHPV